MEPFLPPAPPSPFNGKTMRQYGEETIAFSFALVGQCLAIGRPDLAAKSFGWGCYLWFMLRVFEPVAQWFGQHPRLTSFLLIPPRLIKLAAIGVKILTLSVAIKARNIIRKGR